jgi:hypothetical protein
MTPDAPSASADQRLRGQLNDLVSAGVLAAHVGMLKGMRGWDIDHLPDIVVIFPVWITVIDQVRTAARVRRLMGFIRSRYGPGPEFSQLASAVVVQRATPPGPPSELDQAQSIPAWQWALVSIAHHCAQHVHMEDPRAFRREIGVPEPFAEYFDQ